MRPAGVVAIAVLAFASLLFTANHAASLNSSARRGGGSKSYAVIFDAGSSGSRVHVFCFDENLNIIHIGEEFELFVQVKPGLSSYADYPQQAANSLLPLLKKAESVIPTELRKTTPVKVGATAGLRALGADKSENILQAVRNLIQEKSSLKFQPDWVSVLDGTQEGSFQWATINYLLGNLGKKYPNTAGVVDLGGGSVQMAYAISKDAAANAPRPPKGEDSYVKKLSLKGAAYDLYVHSYLNYGLLAARVEILKSGSGNYSNCILKGYQGTYIYGGKVYPASSSPVGSTFSGCQRDAVKALEMNEQVCTSMKCTFGGVWNGGGGDGQKKLYVASFFFDRAVQAGFVDPDVPSATVRPTDFQDAAKRACKLNVTKAKEMYRSVSDDNIPYLCMDLVYQYSLLVDGFGLSPRQEITLVKKLKYGDAFLEAAWPLGSAIEVASSGSFVSNIDSA